MLSSVNPKFLLSGVFILISAILVMTGLLGFITLNRINVVFYEYNDILKGLNALNSVKEYENSVMSCEDMSLNTEDKNEIYKKIEFSLKEIEENFHIYESLPRRREEELMWKEFLVSWQEWRKNHDTFINLLYEKEKSISDNDKTRKRDILKNDVEVQEVFSLSKKSFSISDDKLNNLIEIKRKISEETFIEAVKQIKSGKIIIINSVIIGIIMVILLGIITAGKINKGEYISPEQKNEASVLVEELERIVMKLRNTIK